MSDYMLDHVDDCDCADCLEAYNEDPYGGWHLYKLGERSKQYAADDGYHIPDDETEGSP